MLRRERCNFGSPSSATQRRAGHEAFLQRFGQPFHPMLRLHSMDLQMAGPMGPHETSSLCACFGSTCSALDSCRGSTVCEVPQIFWDCRRVRVLLLLLLGGLLFPAQPFAPSDAVACLPKGGAGRPGDDLGREPPVHRIRVIWHAHGSWSPQGQASERGPLKTGLRRAGTHGTHAFAAADLGWEWTWLGQE